MQLSFDIAGSDAENASTRLNKMVSELHAREPTSQELRTLFMHIDQMFLRHLPNLNACYLDLNPADLSTVLTVALLRCGYVYRNHVPAWFGFRDRALEHFMRTEPKKYKQLLAGLL